MKQFALFIIIVFITGITQILFSQTNDFSIKGRIITIENYPVSYATVLLKIKGKKTSADINGYFELRNLSALADTLVISSVGMQTILFPVSINNHQTLDVGTITVKATTAILQDVEITGRAAQSYKSDYTFATLKTQTALNKTPQSVSTITKELIKDKMEFTLKDALENIAGANQYSGFDEYTVRGFRAENPHLINGLRSYNTVLVVPLLVNIERVEVIKGPASVLYGNEDPGGTINLVTKKPLPDNNFNVDVYKGSWDSFRAQADITGALNSSKDLLYRFNAGYNNAESFRNNYFNKALQLAPSFSFISKHKIQLNADFSLSNTNTIADRGQPGFLNNNNLYNTPINLSVYQPGDYLKETDISSIISFSYKFNKHITFNSAYLNYITKQQLAEHGIKNYITADSVYLYYTRKEFNTITNSLSNFITFNFNTGNVQHELLAGYDFIRSTISLNVFDGERPGLFGEGSGIVGTFSLLHPRYINRPVKKYKESDDASDVDADAYTTQGIYMQEQLTYKKWTLLMGFRGEFYRAAEEADDDDNDSTTEDAREDVFLPRIALMYALKPNINLYVTYNKGFDPFEASVTRQFFNNAPKPIYSTLYEFGAKADLIKNKLSATLSVYQLTLKNVAVNANDAANPDLYVQRGKEQARGFEMELNGNILSNLSIAFAFAHNIAKVKESEVPSEIGNIKENAPKNSGSSWVKYSFDKGLFKNIFLSAGHSQVSKRNTLVQGLTLPSYFVLNAGAGYVYKNFRLALNVYNLTNKIYWSGGYNYISKWPGASRSYMINVSYNLKRN